jgi:hypothetical protein
MELLQPRKKGWYMNTLENYYIQWHQHKDSLIQEQDVGEKKKPYSHLFSKPDTIHMRQATRLPPNTQPQHNQAVHTTQ